MSQFPYGHGSPPPPPPPLPPLPRKRMPVWAWVLIVFGVLVVVPCTGVIGYLFYVGSVGPDTSVYTGNRVPGRFLTVMRDVGALEEGETIHYFYSTGMSDIRDGFYFVSDRRVVMYVDDSAEPLIAIPFDEIEAAHLHRDTSFFVDSVITLDRSDGYSYEFPVSSEYDRDRRFFEVIERNIPPSE